MLISLFHNVHGIIIYAKGWFEEQKLKQFLVKNECGGGTKKRIFEFFTSEIFLCLLLKFLNIVSPNQSQKPHSFYRKKLQSLN